jgi:hypothetical protein
MLYKGTSCTILKERDVQYVRNQYNVMFKGYLCSYGAILCVNVFYGCAHIPNIWYQSYGGYGDDVAMRMMNI